MSNRFGEVPQKMMREVLVVGKGVPEQENG